MKLVYSLSWRLFFVSFLFVPFFSLAGASNQGPSKIALTLIEALNKAKHHHVNVIIAQEKVNQAVSRLKQARSVLWPQVSGILSETRQTRNLEAQGITIPGRDPLVGPFNTFDARVRVTQDLLNISVLASLSAVEAQKELSLNESFKAQEEAIALVATLYIEAQRAIERLNVAQALLNRDEEAYRLAKARLNLGTDTSVSLMEFSSLLEESRHRVVQFQTEAFDRKMDLIVALNLSVDEDYFFPEDPFFKKIPLPSEEEIKIKLSSHPAIEVAEGKLKVSKANQKKAMAEFVPKISARADYGASGTLPQNSEGTYAYGGQLDLPLFEGGLRMGQMKEAKSQVRESEVLLKDTQAKTLSLALSARESVIQAQSLIDSAEADRQEASKTYELSRQRLQSGLGSQFEVTKAKAQLALAQDQLSEARATYHLAELNLVYSLGEVDSFLDFINQSHYHE